MATIPRFTLVQISSSGDGHPAVIPWSPAAYEQPGLSTAHKILGVTMTPSAYQEPVMVMRRGLLRDVTEQNGESWSVGDILWAASDGSITKTRPAAPLPFVLVGTVFEATSAIAIDVDVRALPSLGELSGVSVDAPEDGDVFVFNVGTHCWEPKTIGPTHTERVFVLPAPPGGTTTFPFFVASGACTITKARAIQIGSGSCTVNGVKNGTTDVIGSELTPAVTWQSSAVLTVALTAGDAITVRLTSVAGDVSYIAVQFDVEEGLL